MVQPAEHQLISEHLNRETQNVDNSEYFIPPSLRSKYSFDKPTHLKARFLYERLKEFGLTSVIPETAITCTLLHLHNFLALHPESTVFQISQELSSLARYFKQESMDKADPRIPTIGIEIEVLLQHLLLHGNLAKTLREYDIIVKPDSTDLTELEISPSYSAAVQARIVAELFRIHAIPNLESFASLHITLGVQTENPNFSENKRHKELAYCITDLITCGYVPSERIFSRKFDWKRSCSHNPGRELHIKQIERDGKSNIKQNNKN